MGYIYTKSGKLAKRLYFGAVLLFEGLYYTFKNRVLADGGTFVENELPTISQDASLVLTPNAYKAGKLYSAVPNDGTGDFTVDRNSTATYIGQDGLIKTALANEPRIDWSTGEAVILREEQSTNLIAYSQNFNFGESTKTGGVQPDFRYVEVNVEISPDSTQTAARIYESNNYDDQRIYQALGALIGTYTYSVFLKKGTQRYGGIKDTSYSETPLLVDLETGEILKTPTLTPVLDYGVKSYSNGFFRLYITVSSDSSDSLVPWIIHSNTPTYTADYIGTGKYFIAYGFQTEEGELSSYIPTNGATKTRLADDISVATPAGVTSITETKNGVEQTPITTIPATYSLPVGDINKVKMQ